MAEVILCEVIKVVLFVLIILYIVTIHENHFQYKITMFILLSAGYKSNGTYDSLILTNTPLQYKSFKRLSMFTRITARLPLNVTAGNVFFYMWMIHINHSRIYFVTFH